MESVSATMVLPHRIMSSMSGAEWEGKPEDETFLVHYNIVNYDFIETFKIEMAEGRSFSEEFSDDTNFGFVLNQEAIRQMGLVDPIDTKFSISGMEGKINGVMKESRVIQHINGYFLLCPKQLLDDKIVEQGKNYNLDLIKEEVQR